MRRCKCHRETSREGRGERRVEGGGSPFPGRKERVSVAGRVPSRGGLCLAGDSAASKGVVGGGKGLVCGPGGEMRVSSFI